MRTWITPDISTYSSFVCTRIASPVNCYHRVTTWTPVNPNPARSVYVNILGSPLVPSRHERKAAKRNRSFRRRQAPVTPGQRRALRELWPHLGLNPDHSRRWNLQEIFGRPCPVVMDIGFGGGESILGMAAGHPGQNFVGVEVQVCNDPCLPLDEDQSINDAVNGTFWKVHKPGIAAAIKGAAAEGLKNVRLVQGDALTVLRDNVEDSALSRCCVFFPDPFPHERDVERRLLRPLFLTLLSEKLEEGGTLHVATDVEEYALHTMRLMGGGFSSGEEGGDPVVLGAGVSGAAGKGEGDGFEEVSSGVDGDNCDSCTFDSYKDFELGEECEGRHHHRLRRCGDQELSAGGWVWEGGQLMTRPAWRPETKYERKGLEEGRAVWDFEYRLVRSEGSEMGEIGCPLAR